MRYRRFIYWRINNRRVNSRIKNSRLHCGLAVEGRGFSVVVFPHRVLRADTDVHYTGHCRLQRFTRLIRDLSLGGGFNVVWDCKWEGQAVCGVALIPSEWRGVWSTDCFPYISLQSTMSAVDNVMERNPVGYWTDFALMSAGQRLSPDACTPEQLAKCAGTGQCLAMPTFTTQNAKCTPLLCVPQLLVLVWKT
jgi:hypothetical protein